MAQVTLTAIGGFVGGPLGAAIGAAVGAGIDRAVVSSLQPPRQIGPRIPGLHVQSTAEGAPMAAVFGHARIAGQIIWAARFKESAAEQRTGGGKGGPKTRDYRYSLSFAVGLCEGPIDGIGRVWADGKLLATGELAMRVYTGTEDQTPDPLIEAVEGAAPAYRGLAYVVFEDMPLDAFGDRPPQLSFEVFRRPPEEAALEQGLRAVCLIPGAGEFALATQPVLRRDTPARTRAENVNTGTGMADLIVSLDQLQAHAPNLEMVTLVVGWFGSDLRCGECLIRPGVEHSDKATLPFSWSVQGIDRAGAYLVSRSGDGPAYGGTPSDLSLLQAIAELKARGLKVGLYPFLLMDIPPDNSLSDPYSAGIQAAYPWRGRITCHPAPGQLDSPDKTSVAGEQVAAFFGVCQASDFDVTEAVAYSGPDEWGMRRFILHYAALAQAAGGVDLFLIGSEMRGLTTVRSGPSVYPAVGALRNLAAQARALLGPDAEIGYAADWSEYFGHQPADGSGDVHFHLDPLWADPDIDFVGVDYYPPLADWRDGQEHLDALAGFKGPSDPAYIAANIAGGEGYDWYYASGADREAQLRTPITDGAYGEPWVFRPKDIWSWWANAHYDRPGGVRAAAPTAWTPGCKPIRLIEYGCAAIDRGANAPNLFIDPKSAESASPPFSSGVRDEAAQRACLTAIQTYFADAANNPASGVYSGPMVAGLQAWCWDARPYPAFPARSDVWADAGNWRLGHWLNGRLGLAPLPALIRALGERAGVQIGTEGVAGLVGGYIVERPMRVRDALSPLAEAFAAIPAERGGEARFVGPGEREAYQLGEDDLAMAEEASAARVLDPPPDLLRLRFIDQGGDYRTGALVLRRDPELGGGVEDMDIPIIAHGAQIEALGRARQARQRAVLDQRTLPLSPLGALRLEAGDLVRLPGADRVWLVSRIDLDEAPRALLIPAESEAAGGEALLSWVTAAVEHAPGPAVLRLLDLPLLPGREEDIRPLAALCADPWIPRDLYAGVEVNALTVRGRAMRSAGFGETLSSLPQGPLHRIDRAATLAVRLEGAALQSRSQAAVLAGANALALWSGEFWEIIQFLDAEQSGENIWTLRQLLRGQQGTADAMPPLLAAGAPAVLLDDALVRCDLAMSERGLPYVWRAAPAGGPPGGVAMTEAAFTWHGAALRPWAPCHLRLAKLGEDLLVGWTRRARIDGDSWEGEPPLGEAQETYRIVIMSGETVVRAADVLSPNYVYSAEDQSADFPDGVPNPLLVRVRQGSAAFGWGAEARRALAWRA